MSAVGQLVGEVLAGIVRGPSPGGRVPLVAVAVDQRSFAEIELRRVALAETLRHLGAVVLAADGQIRSSSAGC
jgi:hypothetical protein